jgi:nicotinamidase-related amidase
MAPHSVADAQLLLLEAQVPMVASSRTTPGPELARALGAVTQAAKQLDIPVSISSVAFGADVPPLINELAQFEPMLRSTVSALADEAIHRRLHATRRGLLAVGGMSSEIAILHTALGAKRAGFDVHVLVDCCGGLSERSEMSALRQMEAADVTLSSLSSFLSGLVGDMRSPEGQVVMGALATYWAW